MLYWRMVLVTLDVVTIVTYTIVTVDGVAETLHTS